MILDYQGNGAFRVFASHHRLGLSINLFVKVWPHWNPCEARESFDVRKESRSNPVS